MKEYRYFIGAAIAQTDEDMSETVYIHPLRAARTAQGLTREDLASRTGLSFETIERVEQGKACHRSTRVAIGLALGLPVDDLFEPEQLAA